MQHPLSDAISSNEEAFILRALEKGLRVDGRRLLEVRPIHIEFGAAVPGTCELRLGQTRVLATATAELVEPYQDRPAEGLLQFSVEFSPMDSPVFEPGRPSEAAVELTRLLERAIRKSQAIDVEALCVVPSKRVWSVRCDITVMDHRGNLTDAAVLAALAALRHLRLPGTACEAGLTRRPPSATAAAIGPLGLSDGPSCGTPSPECTLGRPRALGGRPRRPAALCESARPRMMRNLPL